MIAILGYVHEIEKRLAAGWKYEPHHPHPVLRAYGRMYFYREEEDGVEEGVALEPDRTVGSPTGSNGKCA